MALSRSERQRLMVQTAAGATCSLLALVGGLFAIPDLGLGDRIFYCAAGVTFAWLTVWRGLRDVQDARQRE